MTEEFVAERAMKVASSGADADAERLSALHVAAAFNHLTSVFALLPLRLLKI